MFKPNKTLGSILKPFNRMKIDLEQFIADQDVQGNKADDKADELRRKARCHYLEADKARESLNVINAIIPKEVQ